MKKSLKVLLALLCLNTTSTYAQTSYDRNEYLVMYKEAAEYFADSLGFDVEPGIYLSPREVVNTRKDLINITGGDVWENPVTDDEVILGWASGEVANTRSELWVALNNKYFLIVDQDGNHQRINKGVPLEIIPVVDGMFIVTKDEKIIFRYNNPDKNSGLFNQRPKKIHALEKQFYTFSRDGKSLIYLDDKKDIYVHHQDGRRNLLAEDIEFLRNGNAQVAITPDGIYLPKDRGAVRLVKLNRAGDKIDTKIIFDDKRPTEQIIFKNNKVFLKQAGPTGNNTYQILESGLQSTHRSGNSRAGTRPSAEDLRSLRNYTGEIWTDKAYMGEFENVVKRSDYVYEVLEYLKSIRKTWVNIVAPYGAGKKDLMKSIAQEVFEQSSRENGEWESFEVVRMSLANMMKLQAVGQQLAQQAQQGGGQGAPPQNPLVKVMQAIKSKRVIVMMDNFLDDPEVGATNATKAMDAFLKMFRADIASGKVRIVTTCTDTIWQKVTSGNPELSRMVNVVQLQSPDLRTLKEMTKEKMRSIGGEYKVLFESGMLEVIIDAAKELYPMQIEPYRTYETIRKLSRHFGSISDRASVVTIKRMQAKNFFMSQVINTDTLKNMDIESIRRQIKGEIFGQDAALDIILRRLSVLRGGLYDLEGPLATLFLSGPTGVGKTSTVKHLANMLQVPLVSMDMNHFTEFDPNSAVVRSIKANKGRPFILLLDDVDKSPDGIETLGRLRNMMEKGIYAQNTANELDVRNAIIIFTANYGSKAVLENMGAPYPVLFNKVMKSVLTAEDDKDRIPAHLWSRIQSNFVVFQALDRTALKQIAFKTANELANGIEERDGIEVIVDDQILENLVENSLNFSVGATPIINHVRITLRDKIVGFLDTQRSFSRGAPGVIAKIKKIYVYFTEAGEIEIVSDLDSRFPSNLR